MAYSRQLGSYLLTPWCSPSWKLNWFAASQKFHSFHGTRRFITALTSVRHLSLSWTSPIQSIYPHPTSWRSILILSTHLCLGLPSGLRVIYVNNCPTRCNTNLSIYYFASSFYMFRLSNTPIIRNTQNCNYSLRYCSYLSPAWPGLAALEGGKCTKNMTSTGGCIYSFVYS